MNIAQSILGTFVDNVNLHTGYSMLYYNHSKGTEPAKVDGSTERESKNTT